MHCLYVTFMTLPSSSLVGAFTVLFVFAIVLLTPSNWLTGNNCAFCCVESLLPGWFFAESADRGSQKDMHLIMCSLQDCPEASLYPFLWWGRTACIMDCLPSDLSAVSSHSFYLPCPPSPEMPISLVRHGLVPWCYSWMFDYLFLVSNKSVS